MTSQRKQPIPPPIPRLSRREHFEAFGFSLVVAMALFSGTWGKVLFFRDLSIFFYPGIFFFKQSLLAGEIPLWNPYYRMGYPFLAELNVAVLYPLNLLRLFFSIPQGMKIVLTIHYLLTGYWMWRLLREWGVDQLSGLFGALIWMASGYLVSMNCNFSYLFPLTWYPALLFCFHRLLLTRRIRWLLLTGLCWTLFFLGGDPQAFLFAIVLILLYARLGFPRPTPSARNHRALILLAGALTFFLILAQFLPSLEFGANCTKLKGIDFKEAVLWSHHPLRLLEWVWPELWGPAFPDPQFWGRFLRIFGDSTWSSLVYIGLFPLVLALAQLRSWREKPIGFLVLTLVIFFVLALGYYSPLYRLVWAAVPPYRIFRYPEKHLAVATFALAALAAFSFKRRVGQAQEIAGPAWIRTWTILTAGLFAVFVTMLLASPALSTRLADLLRLNYQFTIEPSFIRHSLLHAGGRSLAVAVAFLVLLLLAQSFPGVKRGLAPILILLTAADLLPLGRAQLIGTDPSFYTFQPVAGRIIRQAQAGRSERFRVFRTEKYFEPDLLPYPQVPTESEQEYYWLRDTLRYNLAMPEGLEFLMGYDPGQLTRFSRFLAKPTGRLVNQMLNVKYMLDGLGQGEFPVLPDFSVVGQDSARNLVIYEDHGYFPRAYFVDGVVAAKDEENALDLLDTADLKLNVVLIRPTDNLHPGRVFLPAEIKRYQNQEVVVTIFNPVPGHLVLSDSYFPGWQAEVDGKPARILPANYLVRAVGLEQGEHEIVFRYRPWSWRIGKMVSLISLLLSAAMFRFRPSPLAPRQLSSPASTGPL
jgi:hypothetical protein